MINDNIKKHANDSQKDGGSKISRKEALKTAGKYAIFTAASMMTVLSPKKSQAESASPTAPGTGW